MNFDYVIIGGGSAGCVLASRLSEDPNISVCLLEAGNKGKSVLVRTPAALLTLVSKYPGFNNWKFRTTPQKHLGNRQGHQPRGKGLGGSSAINAMLYIRGQKEDYDSWAEQGCTGWSYNDVLPYFIKSENNENGGNAVHGSEGPLQVANQKSARSITYHFIDSCVNSGIKYNNDFNSGDQEGVGLYQVTNFHNTKHVGERCSAAAGYIHPVMDSRKNLTVITGANVSRIIMDGNTAVGAEYTKGFKTHTVQAKKEVLLCAGAIKSPQILMLSGIGPREHLEEHNIPVVVESPEVGNNLQDHLDFTLMYRAKNFFDTDYVGIGVRGVFDMLTRQVLKFKFGGRGNMTTPYAEGAAFFKADEKAERPDVQLHFLVAISEEHGNNLHYGYGFSCHTCVLRPKSRGTIRLANTNAKADPLIDMNFFAEQEDRDIMLKGVKKVREIMKQQPIAHRVKHEIYTEDAKTDEELMEHIVARADTIYHPVGTCAMGTDEKSVVTPDLRVKGANNLRVIDASIMPTLISGNTNAPVIMIAEKIADQIKAELAS